MRVTDARDWRGTPAQERAEGTAVSESYVAVQLCICARYRECIATLSSHVTAVTYGFIYNYRNYDVLLAVRLQGRVPASRCTSRVLI
jgi:hypothetical protein